ncbi:MAG: nucleoside phosphorylase [Sulfurimonas sp.]|jgi:nucleoside phosphorylase
MLYIICALKPEAQAFVDKYKLSKNKQNTQITVIVSGIGSENMFNTTKNVVNKMNKDDIVINVGICGGDKKFAIGELIDASTSNLTCVEYEISKSDLYELADMESSGFIRATKNVENKYIFKVVSDHFEPHTVTKEKTKSIIFNVIDDINNIINFKVVN